MSLRSVSGWVAAISGGLLVIGVVAATVAGSFGWTGARTATAAMGPSMMGAGGMFGAGPGTIGGGMGPGMMGGMPMMPMAGGMGAMGGMMRGYGGAYTTDGPIAGAPEVRVQAENFRFDPGEIRLPKDRAVNVTLVNTTGVVHDLTVPALGIRLVAAAGTTRTIGLPSLPAGRYVAYCSVPGHADAGMRATVVVE